MKDGGKEEEGASKIRNCWLAPQAADPVSLDVDAVAAVNHATKSLRKVMVNII